MLPGPLGGIGRSTGARDYWQTAEAGIRARMLFASEAGRRLSECAAKT